MAFSQHQSAPQGEFIRGLHNLQSRHHGNVVTIGAFDGVHLGHQAILDQVISTAKSLKLPSLVMIFEPQPHEFFSGEKAPARLMRLREKIEALFASGIDRVFCLPFNKPLSCLSPEAFVQNVLIDGLGVEYLVIGDDFRFGRDRQGDYTLLKQASERYQFDMTDTATYTVDDHRVSSTLIRRMLEASDFSHAERLLGRPYTISGTVVRGEQIGRTLGAPTANVHLHRFRSPLAGVFSVVTQLATGETVNGVANVGVRPTLGGISKPILEVHLFDRNDDLYGQHIIVEFKYKIREEKRFDNLTQLRQQITQDIQQARKYFAG